MISIGGIGGRYLGKGWQSAEATYELSSPIDRTSLGGVADLGAEAGQAAADVAWQAFTTWRTTTPFERAELLLRWQKLMLDHTDVLAETMSREMGKPLRESRGEVVYAAGFIAWYAEEAKRIYG